MKNIFLFIRRHFNLLLFLFLQLYSIYMIVHYSRYHEAAFGEMMNDVTGKINGRYYAVHSYLHLKKANDSLLKVNERLYNQLRENYAIGDSIPNRLLDTLKFDSLAPLQKIKYHGAHVISNSISSQSNYLVLDKGAADSVKEGMGVIDAYNAVVGIVTQVSSHYAVVMSLLHKDSHLSGKLLRTGETGTLSWDGLEPNLVTLNNIPKSTRIYRGDTVISSGFSTAIPRGKMMGRVESLIKESGNNFYRVKFRTSANFYNLQYVYIIENADQEGVNAALEQVKSQH